MCSGLRPFPKTNVLEKKKKSELELEDPLVLPCAWALDGTQKQRGKETVSELSFPADLEPAVLRTRSTPALPLRLLNITE